MLTLPGASSFLTLALWLKSAYVDREPIALTSLGRIQGTMMTSSKGRSFHAYRGIPYAKPPIDELRFQDPVERGPWTGVLDATREGPTCMQYNSFTGQVEGVEDCLAINVYTHSTTSLKKRPVMIWVHGGGYYFGSGNGETYWYGPSKFMDREIVLVTFNYRLGPLGFLSTEDAAAPGNYGLLDQSMALRWVKKHIKAFGGDENSITIFGESAGGASVEYQLLSPWSQGLFHRAIIESGSVLCHWGVFDHVRNYTVRVAESLTCPTDSQGLVDCLRKQKPADIVATRSVYESYAVWPLAFGPRVDKERSKPFVPENPRQIIESGSFSRVPIILGANQNEAAFIVAAELAFGGALIQKAETDLAESMPYHFGIELEKDTGIRSLEAFKHYFGDSIKPSENLHLYEQMLSDSTFLRGVSNSLDYHARYSQRTYAYYYTQRTSCDFPRVLGISPDVDLGVSHANELFLMFDAAQCRGVNTTDTDEKMADLLLDYWTSFATKGVPFSAAAAHQPWLPHTVKQPRYMNLNTRPTLVSGQLPFKERIKYWDAFYSQ